MTTLARTLLTVAFAATVSVAQLPSARADKAQSKLLFQRAERAFAVGAYAAALRDYRAAHSEFAHPSFLFNIGQCHRNLGQVDAAIEAFSAYLSSSDAPSDRAQVEALIRELEGRRPGTVPARDADPRREAEPAASSDGQAGVDLTPAVDAIPAASPVPADADRGQAAPAAASSSPPQTSPPELIADRSIDAPTPVTSKWWFWTLVGVGVVGGGVAIAAASSGGEPPMGSLATIDFR